MIRVFQRIGNNINQGKLWELALSLVVGLLFAFLVVYSPYLPISSDFQKLVLVIPFAFTAAILFNNLDRLILFTLAIGVPLNLDISLIVSPYARNAENIAKGYRTLISITELRLSFVMIMLLIGYAVWLLKPRQTRKVSFFGATTLPALGFIFISVLSVIQAQDTQLWMFRIAQLAEVFLVYFYLANHIRTTQDMQFFIVVSLLGMIAESLLMIVQWITGLTFQIAGIQAVIIGGGRVAGTLGWTQPAAGYLTALVLIAMSMLWGFPRKSGKILAVSGIGLGIIAMVSTGSRIGWISFAATSLVFVLAGMRIGWIKRETLIIAFIALVALAAIFYGPIYTRFTANDYGSASARPMMWKLAWNVIKAHPWLGVGAGNYALVTPQYYTPDIGDPAEVLNIQVHNSYLDVWAESGTFALLCYLALFGAAIIKAWSCIKSRSRFVSLMGMALGLAIVSLCIQMFTDTFHLPSITLFTWSLIALAASLPRLERTHRSPIGISESHANFG